MNDTNNNATSVKADEIETSFRTWARLDSADMVRVVCDAGEWFVEADAQNGASGTFSAIESADGFKFEEI